MNSAHGFWIALAKWGHGSWFRPSWWPYWGAGLPIEFTYQPLIPRWVALWSSLTGISWGAALERITGIVYCLGPVTLFVMAWLATKAPGYSFIATAIYSLTSLADLLVPDQVFKAFDAHRLYLLAVWDDLPHLTALMLLPLAIICMYFYLRRRRFLYFAAAVALIALATAASLFAPIIVAMAALCLLFAVSAPGRRLAVPGKDFRRNLTLIACIGACAFAISLPFLPPSLLMAVPRASWFVEGAPSGSLAAAALVVTGFLVIWKFVLGRVEDWSLRFIILFTFVAGSVPVIATIAHWRFMPQPTRYKLELEFALPLLLVFGARIWLDRTPRLVRAVLSIGLGALGIWQIGRFQDFAQNVLRPASPTTTIEYRVSRWIDENLHGVRVMLPGSIDKWANAFTEVPQFMGEAWSTTYNATKLYGWATVVYGGDAKKSLTWLGAYGTGAIAVSGPKSPEFWKPLAYPGQFEGVLPVLWRADDTTIYRIPQRTSSLAHVLPETAVVKRIPAGPNDTQAMELYVAALEDAALPEADVQWEGHNRIRIRAEAFAGQVISIQISYHPGWHATVAGQSRRLNRDGLGLMWLEPGCNGRCEVELNYDGGWELRICRYVSFATLIVIFAIPFVSRLRPRRPRAVS